MSKNVDLHRQPQNEILLAWLGAGLAVGLLALLGQFLVSCLCHSSLM